MRPAKGVVYSGWKSCRPGKVLPRPLAVSLGNEVAAL